MARPPRRRRLHRALDVLGAACAALLAFTAVPAVLIVIVGNPLAGGLGHAWRPLPHDALCLLVLAAWVAWVACCAQLLRAVVVQVRRGEAGTRLGSSVLDRLAARIAFGVLALTSIGAPLSLAPGAGASTPVLGRPDSPISAPLPAHATLTSTTTSAAAYTVQPGDSLWRIADDLLGDGADWTAIAALNLGREFGGGARFVDPDAIRAGWRLRLPSDGGRAPHGDGTGRADAGHRASGEPPGHLPELIALGIGSVACAALARRAGRRHRPETQFKGDPVGRPAPSDGTLDTAVLLERFAGVPALRSFEAANCLLHLSMHGRASRPTVRAICVSPSGVTFHFPDAHPDDPPQDFERVRDGAAWHVNHDALEGCPPSLPYAPIVLPVGDDAEGTWLIALGPGDVVPVLGEAAPALWLAARAVVGSWTWSDTVLVTEDPDDVDLRMEAAADPLLARHLLFWGDPASLPPEVAARCAVLTMQPVSGSDLTVLVDQRAATLHPMGVVLRPHLQRSETAKHISELVGGGVDGDGSPALSAASDGPRPAGGGGGARAGADGLSPGTVDVRLLTMTPRLDGLRADLPPNRARRAVELVAYLALHHPDVVTSDRLRTRVLGSSDADAAAKTLFNTAYAARRAMGVDEDGDPLFPAGTRHGLYQLSTRVTTDVQRAAALAAEAKEQSDPAAAIAYFRAALSLVEGEPLANALSGYAWWEAEGHGGRLAAVLVDAACVMASLAADDGLFDLARWGLGQARLVEPYSEALSRAAMQVAAAEGDADRLRSEWRDCQRRIDALDPGTSPSARTESLYGELARRVLVGATLHDGRTGGTEPDAMD